MEIKPYTPELEPLVKAFNRRLRDGGETYWSLPECHVPRFPRSLCRNLFQELFLALDNGEVRGGYLLTHSLFAIGGELVWIACGPQLNVCEGLVDRKYGMTGTVNVRDALKRQPFLYGVGMGGLNMPQARLLMAMKWRLRPVPFFFKVLNSARFFSNITYLRGSKSGRLLTDVAQYSGLGSAGIRIAQFRTGQQNNSAEMELVPEFGVWADELWSKCKSRYSLVAVRDSATLNTLYPSSDARFLRLRITRARTLLGWAVALNTQMSGHKQFGNMRVGSIVDCLAAPEDAVPVVRTISAFLENMDLDLIISNQASSQWGKGFLAAGYLPGPSNFILALSPMLAKRLEPLDSLVKRIHMNRGDGDGPIHL